MSFKFLKNLSAGIILLAGFSTTAYSLDVNSGAFVGQINTTVSSGFSMRVQDRDCKMIDGYSYSEASAADAAVVAFVINQRVRQNNADPNSSALSTYTTGSAGGCAGYRTDDYGNTPTEFLDFYGNQANDGNLNFDQGDVFSATQKIYTEIDGTLNGETGIRLSAVGSYNPALDISSPIFKQLNSDAEEAFESDFSLLDAYITHSIETEGTFVDLQLGRFVTSWGEATFLPIGMNGLVTNALDLSKLRAPGSGVKEALIPTETLSVALGLEDGSGLEFYYQFSNDMIELDPSGAYFGSETFGRGANSILSTGANYRERMAPDACPHMAVGTAAMALAGYAAGNNLGCTLATATDWTQNADNWRAFDTTHLVTRGFDIMTATEWAMARGVAMAHNFTANQDALTAPGFNGLNDDGSRGHVAISAGWGSGTAVDVDRAMSLLPAARFDKAGTVDLYPDPTGLFAPLRDDGQYGFRFNKYVDNIGTGVDFGLYFANYHSKVPYVQFSMPGNVFAGDILGAYLLAAGDAAGTLDTAGVMPAGTDNPGVYDLTGTQQVHAALSNAALSVGLCSAVMKAQMRNLMVASGATNYAASNAQEDHRDNLMIQAYFGEQFSNGDRTHDSSECFAMVDTLGRAAQAAANVANGAVPGNTGAGAVYDATTGALHAGLLGTGARLFAAVTPINMITYQGIFPEDNKVYAASFSTNVGTTTLQGELAYRPDFPLATDASDQINQLNDKNGANDALNFVAIAGADAAAANAAVGSVGTGDALAATATAFQTAAGLAPDRYFRTVAAYERSTLGDVLDSNGNATTNLTARYYSKPFIEYDVWSGSLGTTTSFTASDPVTKTIGADSVALLTEFGFVSIRDLNDAANGYVARNGANEGPASGTNKCLGAIGTSNTGLDAAGAAISNLGAGIVDALFGNGGYCEAKPGADDMSMTYRIIGTANYSNFANTAWSLSPNFAWAHDFNGYGPSSLGGFVEDRMTLSLGASLNKGGTTVSGSYVSFIDDEFAQSSSDKDYVSVSVSHSF